MKFFDTDWNCIFRWMTVWEKLSLPARHYYLSAQSHAQTLPPEGYGEDREFAVRSGFLEAVSTGRLKPTKASVPFRALMAQLAKFPLFERKPSRQMLDDYVRKHYPFDESGSIQSAWNGPCWDSLAWPQSFLDQKDVGKWEKAYLSRYEISGPERLSWGGLAEPSPTPKLTWFGDARTVEAAQHLVRQALETVQPIPLISLPEALPERLRPSLEPALKACLRFMLLYPALRQNSLQAVIGLCPTLVYILSRPAAVRPAVEPAKDLVGPAFLMEDMTRVLAEAATGECRLNRNGCHPQFFKVIEEKLREEFVPLPPWLQPRHEFGGRLADATTALAKLKLVEDTTTGGQRLLVASAKGRKWLAKPAADRLRELLFEMKRGDPDEYEDPDDPLAYLPGEFRFEGTEDDAFDHQSWLSSIWRQAPVEGCVALDVFLDYHSRVSQPLVNSSIPEAERPSWAVWSDGGTTELRAETVEDLCRSLLAEFFWEKLVPLGCVETAVREENQVWFRLSPAGEYLFGVKAALAYGQPVAEAAVIIQPNFEIVFLHPNLAAEVELSPIAERSGNGVGTLFRLTRARTILAASRGVTAETMLAILQKHSSKPLPANVAEEIRSWFGACRTLPTRRSVLIEAGDRETALRVRRLFGPGCVELKDTLLECRGEHIEPKIRKKLMEEGIFLEGA